MTIRTLTSKLGAISLGRKTLQARMSNSATVLPDVMQPIQALFKAIGKGGVPQSTLFNRLNVTTRQVAGAWG